MVKHLSLEINSTDINEELITQLEGLFSAHRGNKDLKFRLKDVDLAADIRLISSEWQVNPNGELIRELREMGLKYKLV